MFVIGQSLLLTFDEDRELLMFHCAHADLDFQSKQDSEHQFISLV